MYLLFVVVDLCFELVEGSKLALATYAADEFDGE